MYSRTKTNRGSVKGVKGRKKIRQDAMGERKGITGNVELEA